MSETPAPPHGLTAPGKPLAPFRFPAFRAIWTANLASNLGSMVQSTGAAWLMTELTTSHQLVALIQASVTLPVMLLGVIAGAIADNYDRRRVMLAAQWVMLVLSAALAVLTWQGLIGPLSLLAFTLAVGCGTALNGPAWQASVRLQVGPADLPQAISLNTIAYNLARSVGPALGGLLISLASTATAFALNALSYLALIVVLLRWHPQQAVRERQPMFASILAGIRFCASSSPVRRILLRGFAFGFGAAGYLGLQPLLVREQLHGTETQFGLSLGAFGIGSIVVALWIAPVRRRFGGEAVVGMSTLIFAMMLLPISRVTSLPALLALTLVAGGAWVAVLTSLNVAMQLRSPEAILGRCLAIYQAVTFGGMALGAYAMGLASDLIGLSGAVQLSAALLLASLALRWLAPMPGRDEGRV
ncbi:MFS transporter [Novosphingobium sp.]|uniref:MFS transporter n=1 Tax=Novosphingobium sp. TaxID=1874826 RepID=UPI0035B2B50C